MRRLAWARAARRPRTSSRRTARSRPRSRARSGARWTRSPSRSKASRRRSNTAARARREGFAERRARHEAIDDPAVVLEAALRFLEARHRSVAEVRRRLTSAGYPDELITAAVDRLAGLGMLNDQAFATQWVESRDRARPRGERALRSELAQRGVDRTTVDAVLAERRGGAGAGGGELGRGGEWAAARSPDGMAAERLLERRGKALAPGGGPRIGRPRASG